MSKTLTYSRPQTSMKRSGSVQLEADAITYEDLLIAKYLEELKKAPPYTKTDVQVEKSPYLQKLAHTHVVPIQMNRPPSAAQTGRGFATSGGKGSRPVSAKPHSYTSGGWDSDQENRRKGSRAESRSQFTAPSHNNWSYDNEPDGGTYIYNDRTGKQRIDPRFIGDDNFKDPVSTKGGKRPRPLSAPLCKRPYTCSSRPMSAKSVSYTKKARSLYRLKAQTIVVTAYKNGSRDIFARVAAPNLKQLLETCTDKLGLSMAARRIFLEDGQEVFVEKDLQRDDSVYISTGEPFKDPEKGFKQTLDASQKSQWTLGGLVCPPGDKKKSQKSKLSKRFRSLLEQSRRRVLVFQNGSGAHSAEIVTDPKRLEDFLAMCTAKLDLGNRGRILYDWDGNEVTDLEQAPVLDQCLQTWSTPVLGPLWLSKGEGFSPKGANDFLTGLINYTKTKLKEAKNYKKQLMLAQDEDTKDQVEVVAILSMSPKEIEDNISMADKDIEDFSNALNRLNEQKNKLQDQVVEEERYGSKFTMKHIQEYEIDHKLVGKKGMRLKIYENGTSKEPTVIYFNVQQASKGGEDNAQLLRRLLDQCGSITSLAYPKKNPAICPIAKRLFTSSGKEIKSVKDLNYDDELWLSFGEPWRDPHTYAIALQIDKVTTIEIDNAKKVLREQLLIEDTKDEDSLKGGKWEVVNGLPDEARKRIISEPAEKESMKTLLVSNEISPDNNCFLRHKEKSVILYGEVIVNKKAAKSDEVWPPESQIWVLTKDGYFHCKAVPQFVLGLTARKIKTHLQRPGKSENIPVEGYVVTVQKRNGNDLNQQWTFTSDGYVCSRGSPNLVLTYLGARYGDEESQINNEESSTLPGEKVYLAACPLLNSVRPAKSQRWALKQERLDNLGQWRYTKADNPEWHKQALSWPTGKDGKINEEYDWPMEGYLLPYAPPLKNSTSDKNYGDAPLRLQVLKNGIKDVDKAVSVVAPDLSLMKKGVHGSQNGAGHSGHSHSSGNHGNVKSGKGNLQGKAMTEAADSESINDTMLHCDPDQTVLKLEFNMFLDRCTSLLDLPFPARRLFDKDGLEHFNLRSLKRDQLVTVTCGEPWSDPKLSKAEQQRRYLLANLAADVAQIQEYIALRNPKNLVLEIEDRVAVGSRLVIGKSFLSDKVSSSSVQENKSFNDESVTSQPADEKIQSDDGSAHQIAHQRSEERLTRLKWPWERLYNCGDDSIDFTDESTVLSEQQRPKRRTKGVEGLAELQRFVYEDGFIAMESDRSLVLGISHEVSGHNGNVVLAKRNLDDVLQRWILKENGLIQAKHNASLVLTATMKSQNAASLIGCAVTVQRKKSVQFGHANQRWQLDHSSGLVFAFSTHLHDKEITAANRANVCTNAVLGRTDIDQTGYIVEVPEKIGSGQKILVCASCARAMRGRYRLKKLERSVDFACAMGSAKEFGLQPIGSFRCLNGKVDLSTYEAVHTLQHWQKELERLRKETSVHTIAKEILAANVPVAVKVLAYKNGDGKRRVGELVIGSSVSGILHQCTHRLQLSQAARRLYTADGKLILNVDDLTEWAKQNSTLDLENKLQEDFKTSNDDSINQEPEKISEDESISYVGNDFSKVGSFVDDETNVLIIPNPNLPIQSDGSLTEWKIYAVKPGRISLDVLRPAKNQLTYTLAYQTECELVDGELVIDISSQSLPVQSGDVIGFEIKDHGLIPYEIDSTSDAPFLYSSLATDLKIGEKVILQKSPEPGFRQYNLQAKIVANVKPKKDLIRYQEKNVTNGKSAKQQSSKTVLSSADQIFRYPTEVFVSCGENFSKPEKMDLQSREHLVNMSNQLEKEKHVLRMMQGRRTEDQKPGMLKSTQMPDQPVSVDGTLQEPSSQEKDRHDIVHHLQVHLQAMKANQKPKGVKTAKIDTAGRLYMQPNMKRVLIFPNGEKVEQAQYVWGESIMQLLDNSATRLNLSRPAKYLFTLDGDLVTDFDKIERDQILHVSSTKKFMQPQESQQLIAIKANWARANKAHGPGGTNFIVETTKKRPGSVNPFVPISNVQIEEMDD